MAMGTLIFLGTGPAGGIHREGVPERLETSALLKTKKGNILFDVTNDFTKQSEQINNIDAILITHGHSDAIGGIGQLRSWQKKRRIERIPLFSTASTVKIIKRRFPLTEHLLFHGLAPYKEIGILDISVRPFPVVHSMQKGFPTFGYFVVFRNGTSLAYVSDVGDWNDRAKKIMQKATVLILDGAVWGMRMPAHIDVQEKLPLVCQWRNKRIILTQIGKTAPHHLILKNEVRRLCAKATPAYDGLEVSL